MRVATYSQPTAAVHGSLAALAILVVTILLGTNAVHTLVLHFSPANTRVVSIIWLFVYAAAFLGLMFNHGINWISWMTRYRILLVVVLLGTITSVFWSLDSAVSAERTAHLIGCSVVAVYLGFMVPLLTTLRVFGVVLAMIMLASIAASVALPGLGIEAYEGTEVWKGIFNSKNTLGFWSAIAVLLYITLSDSTESIYNKLLCYLLAAMCLGLLLLSHSATSLLALLVAGALSLYLYIAIRFQLGFVRMVVMAILFIGLVAIAAGNISTVELIGRTEDLTGRGEVWRQVWKLIMQRPLTGYGYGSIWFPNDATIWMQQSLTDFTWVVHHAHNGFLQVASEIGLPLSCVALLMVVQQLVEIFYCQYERQQVGVLFVLGFIVAYLISNFSEARFLVNRELYWILFIALPISMLRQINLVADESANENDNTAEAEHGGATVAEFSPSVASGAALATVPGKPWLQLATADVGMQNPGDGMAYGFEQTGNMTAGVEDAVWETWDFEHCPEIGMNTETDIDLGAVLKQEGPAAAEQAETATKIPEGTFSPADHGLLDITLDAESASLSASNNNGKLADEAVDCDETLDLTKDVGDLSMDLTDDSLPEETALQPDFDDSFDPVEYGIDVRHIDARPFDARQEHEATTAAHPLDGLLDAETDRYDKKIVETGDWTDFPLNKKQKQP